MTRTTHTCWTLQIVAFLLMAMPFSSEILAQDNTEGAYSCTPCNSECDSQRYSEGGTCSHCSMPLILNSTIEKNKTMAFYLQDGVEVLDFAGPMEVFAYAGYEVFTVSKSTDAILTQGILKIIPDYGIANSPQADILAFFGGNAASAYEDREVINWVQSQTAIEYYFSVCTGAFILAESGMLQGKSATTFHSALDSFKNNYPEINVLNNVRFIDNGAIITTAGISAGIDGALHLVAKLNGFNVARRTAYHMEYDKWVPGEGLLLAEDNPYKGLMNTDKLKAYVGTYEYLDNSQIEITINDREKSLYAIFDDMKYPLFYQIDGTITNLDDDVIIFERNESDVVTGFKSNKYGNRVFAKLK